MDLRTNKIYSIPDRAFNRTERFFLGNYEGGQAVLVFTDGEFRIYTYNYNDEEDSGNDDGWAFLCNQFDNFGGAYEMRSFGYVVIESSDAEELVAIINRACYECLDYYSQLIKDDLPRFINRRIGKTNEYVKVYSYYK